VGLPFDFCTSSAKEGKGERKKEKCRAKKKKVQKDAKMKIDENETRIEDTRRHVSGWVDRLIQVYIGRWTETETKKRHRRKVVWKTLCYDNRKPSARSLYHNARSRADYCLVRKP
jgi:hypothetical protein